MKLNLGCGNNYLDGYINVDINHKVKCDVSMDFEKGKFPWKSGEVDEIIAEMVVEHIWNIDHFMNECWRVLKKGGQMLITTPTAGTIAYWKDPTHVKGFVEQTFRYYADWNTDAANKRKTWNIVHIYTYMPGDENEFIECLMEKP